MVKEITRPRSTKSCPWPVLLTTRPSWWCAASRVRSEGSGRSKTFEAKSISFCAGYRLEGMWCPPIGDIFGSRAGPEDITLWEKFLRAGSSKCHGSNIHGNTPSNQCARSVLVSFMSVSLLYRCWVHLECNFHQFAVVNWNWGIVLQVYLSEMEVFPKKF